MVFHYPHGCARVPLPDYEDFFDGSTLRLQNVIEGSEALTFVDRWNPLSSAINVAIIPNLDIRFPFPSRLLPNRFIGERLPCSAPYSTLNGRMMAPESSMYRHRLTSFNCVNKIVIPIFWTTVGLCERTCRLWIRCNPQTEISLQEALRFDKTAQLNTVITLMIPQDYVIREQIRKDEPLDHLKIEEFC